ncbi:MAG: nucleoside-diphosphate sugar epimerase/dehydratase, partial [Campylobacterota bacterium]|nr:nucleoside-diphosphate sugar epimerase/dehydratase [Campylobacterota bacterium]
MISNKTILNYLVIISLSLLTFWWTFYIFHRQFDVIVVLIVIVCRILTSRFILNDYNLSWRKTSTKTFLSKSYVYIFAFFISLLFLYQEVEIYFLASELFLYLFALNFLMYSYQAIVNRTQIVKDKNMVIYGAGEAGIKLKEEFKHSPYKIVCFCDDNPNIQKQSIDGIKVISKPKLKELIGENKKDLLVIAIPSASKDRIKEIHEKLSPYFKSIKILPTIQEILRDKNFSTQLKDISVEDLLARHPKDLDKKQIENFIKDKKVLITGAGGSIGSEISRQCANFGAKQLILLDSSEFNLYQIAEELSSYQPKLVMQSVVNIELLDKTFEKYKPDIVIHAAAYKHVPLVEDNITEAILNNIIGTKNTIDCAIKYDVKKFVLISTDKAVRPTNIMGTTKRICELYAQNINTPQNTQIVAVRFGNVLGSSGSVIPKFKAQIQAGKNITVTHPDITRYFMLIPEASELVLQAASIGKGGEIFILDMGESIKIVDLAKK